MGSLGAGSCAPGSAWDGLGLPSASRNLQSREKVAGKRMGEKKDHFKRKRSFFDFCFVVFVVVWVFFFPFVFFPAFCGENDFLECKAKRHNEKQIVPKTNSTGAKAAQPPATDPSVLLHPGLLALPANIQCMPGNTPKSHLQRAQRGE